MRLNCSSIPYVLPRVSIPPSCCPSVRLFACLSVYPPAASLPSLSSFHILTFVFFSSTALQESFSSFLRFSYISFFNIYFPAGSPPRVPSFTLALGSYLGTLISRRLSSSLLAIIFIALPTDISFVRSLFLNFQFWVLVLRFAQVPFIFLSLFSIAAINDLFVNIHSSCSSALKHTQTSSSLLLARPNNHTREGGARVMPCRITKG